MNLLKNIFSFYISSNIHVSMAIFSLTKITLLEYGIYENKIPLFNLFATILVYNFIRFYQIYGLNITTEKWMKPKNISMILLNTFSLIFLFYLMFKIRIEALILLLPFVLAAVFYVVPFASDRKNLRSIASLKLFLIAFTCAGVTVLFPLIQYKIHFSHDIWVIFLQRFLLIVAITIPFDIRDVNFDMPELKTLPQTIGIKKSKLLGLLALLLFFILGLLIVPVNKTTILITFLITLISFLFLIFSTSDQRKYYSSFWVESIPIFWLILVLIF